MNTRQLCILVSTVGALALLAVVLFAIGPASTLLAHGMRTEAATSMIVPPYIYYQGRLVNPGTGQPVPNGAYSMTFRLYTDSSGGTAIATDNHPVTVTSGLFRTYIGFEADSYNGQALWVGVQVGTDPEMAPRHYLRPVPYALSLRPGAVISGAPGGGQINTLELFNYGGRALSAQSGNASAVLAQNSGANGAVSGINNGSGPGGYFRSSGGDALNVDGSALIQGDLTVNGTVWAKSSYQNVLVVAKNGGDYSSIQAALTAITATESNPYLVRVMPGVYNEQVTLKPYVHVQGSGQGITVISCTVATTPSLTSGTVMGANHARLSNLTVVNTHGADHGAAIYNSWDAPTIEKVTAVASGGTHSYGIFNNVSSPTIQDSIATASGGTNNYGILSNSGSAPVIANTTALASGGEYSRGIDNEFADVTIQNCTAYASGATGANVGIYIGTASATIQNTTASASGGADNFGIYVYFGSSASIVHSTATASGGTSENYAVYIYDDSSASIVRSNLIASGGSYANGIRNQNVSTTTVRFSTISAISGTTTYGIRNQTSQAPLTIQYTIISASGGTTNRGINNESPGGAALVRVDDSEIEGGQYAIYAGDANYTVRVTGSALEATTPVSGTATFNCHFSDDGAGNELDATCQIP